MFFLILEDLIPFIDVYITLRYVYITLRYVYISFYIFHVYMKGIRARYVCILFKNCVIIQRIRYQQNK